MWDEVIAAFEELDEFTAEDLFDNLPGAAELRLLCENLGFQIICRVCEHIRGGASATQGVQLAKVGSTFDADELGLTEDL